MPGLEISLLKLYVPLIGWIGLGVLLGHKLPKAVPLFLGKFLFWVGVPLSIVSFLRQTDLSESVWLAPIAAWTAMLLGGGLAWIWIQGRSHWKHWQQQQTLHSGSQANSALRNFTQRNSAQSKRRSPQANWSKPTQGSFLLAAMVGNTGYLGYPVSLALVGPQYFAWAIFYDTLGSTLGAYGLGVALAARFGMGGQGQRLLIEALLKNPALWSFWLGLGFRTIPLPELAEQALKGCGWAVIALSLLLLGMRLSQLTSWQSVKPASISLGIKMLIVPLMVGFGLSYFGVTGPPQLAIVLQMSMPPAFATLVIAEAYNLDRELTVTALAVGSLGLLLTLPIWLWLFSN
ncbi:AEC family transporter [Oculatella sp. FACHB-28]|uniref:AEC family transporter n=1 Tax=Oculatella sp. FACHB-28 TaxID=2692845 RepID=UPI0016896D09|nr:AEC family transporter [Oculatella sp. FACHB-28]MBD2058478.1 AEC family transporter [Oculatella sp. FACHB-28]